MARSIADCHQDKDGTVTNQDPKVKNKKTNKKNTLIYYDTDTQNANVRGNPLRQATKQHLNNSYPVKNDAK